MNFSEKILKDAVIFHNEKKSGILTNILFQLILLAEQAFLETCVSALLLDVFYRIVVHVEGFGKHILTQIFNS